jgi:Raf kinase inhibitor-like YbhB/YbcL family protein
MEISSSAFHHEGSIPKKYTCQGQDINPQLTITEVTPDAKSLALIMDDPDAPNGTWTHWVMWNILPTIDIIAEDSVPSNAVQGKNSWGKNSYGGPCPPSGTHRYYFRLYALDMVLGVHSMDAQQLRTAMNGHILGEIELMGTYEKH